MLQLVQAGIFQDFPNLKIIVHHAGALAPFLADEFSTFCRKNRWRTSASSM